MMLKRFLVLFLILIILSSNVSAVSILYDDNSDSNVIHSQAVLEKHIIKDVPYVEQETNFFCDYACKTMIFNYLGLNTTLDEVLFYSGCAYSLLYPNVFSKYMPTGGYLLCQDTDFIASLFGLGSNQWYIITAEHDDCWSEYWPRVKENISAGHPVLTSVDPFSLSSVRKQFDFGSKLWDLIPPGGHGVVIVGFNESNQSVCFNDPSTGCFGNYNDGVYAWMKIDDFKEAVRRTTAKIHLITTFKKISEPSEEKQAFNAAHDRNIECLKGNLSAHSQNIIDSKNVYDFDLGINSLRRFKNECNQGLLHIRRIMKAYKGRSLNQLILTNALKIISVFYNMPSSFDEMLTQNEFERIAIEKEYVASYLQNNSHISDSCLFDADLFIQEAEKWMELSELYSTFMGKGLRNNLYFTKKTLEKITNTLDEIIKLEEKIIEGSKEKSKNK